MRTLPIQMHKRRARARSPIHIWTHSVTLMYMCGGSLSHCVLYTNGISFVLLSITHSLSNVCVSSSDRVFFIHLQQFSMKMHRILLYHAEIFICNTQTRCTNNWQWHRLRQWERFTVVAFKKLCCCVIHLFAPRFNEEREKGRQNCPLIDKNRIHFHMRYAFIQI